MFFIILAMVQKCCSINSKTFNPLLWAKKRGQILKSVSYVPLNSNVRACYAAFILNGIDDPLCILCCIYTCRFDNQAGAQPRLC